MIQLSRRRFAGSLLAGSMLAGQARAAGRQAPRTLNIVTIVLDDIDFSDLGCFGGKISTPHIDALAKRRLRFNGFDTKAVCSTTHAALLTGRHGHSVNFPDVPDTNFGPFAERYDADAFRQPPAEARRDATPLAQRMDPLGRAGTDAAARQLLHAGW